MISGIELKNVRLTMNLSLEDMSKFLNMPVGDLGRIEFANEMLNDVEIEFKVAVGENLYNMNINVLESVRNIEEFYREMKPVVDNFYEGIKPLITEKAKIAMIKSGSLGKAIKNMFGFGS